VNAWEPHFYEHHPQSQPTVLLALYLEPDWLRMSDRRFAVQHSSPILSEVFRAGAGEARLPSLLTCSTS